jgi:hypothetical protein
MKVKVTNRENPDLYVTLHKVESAKGRKIEILGHRRPLRKWFFLTIAEKVFESQPLELIETVDTRNKMKLIYTSAKEIDFKKIEKKLRKYILKTVVRATNKEFKIW